ncbi:MAG: hypothetical protein ACJA0G_001795 [Kangiellaceae bacterium]|jgi:hypothetical protein
MVLHVIIGRIKCEGELQFLTIAPKNQLNIKNSRSLS